MDVSGIVDIQAESGIIATLIFHPEFILHSEFLKAGYFYQTDSGCIYWAIQELYKAGVDNIDAFNITNMLNSNKAVKNTTEKYNLPSMQEYIDMCGLIARHTLEEYMLLANKVVSLSFKRDLYKILLESQRNCCDMSIDLNELNTRVYDKLNAVTEKYITSNQIDTIGAYSDDLWDEICSRRNESGIYGIPSKFSALNEYCTYEPTELILLTARMKRGKSAFFLNEAVHKLKNGIPTLYIDTEMSDRLFYERMLANLTGVEVKKIKNGKYTEEEAKKIEKANAWIKKQPFVHIYDPQMTKDKLYSTCKILKYKMGLQFVIYDYLKSNTTDASSQYNELGSLCDFLKNNIGGDLELSVLAGAQLNRTGQIADSDKLSRYASVSLLWRDKTPEEISRDGMDCGNFALTVQLNRLGEQMSDEEYLDFAFNGNIMRIEQAKKQHVQEKPFD